MSKQNNFVFKVLSIFSWIIFVGLCIEAGGLLVNFFISIFKPKWIQNLYQKLDLTELYNQSKFLFFGIYSFILCIAILKAVLFYMIIKLTYKINLEKPFSTFVLKQISRISYYTFSIGILSYIGQQFNKNLMHKGFDTTLTNPFLPDSQAFILMAGIIYIIAVIFAKGIDLQNENELTI
ncbi:DUF2975 domain-containing protein [Flavobacterium sp. TP390]|uniref:DUF2975 domain-containing protein n=1 Tax=Flavobacterium profundi TaxID=1774945 RepID=A0A6I4IVY3_9FLAO|nr:DUF2975 domain-containing protein [Flavobacterium profundi]MVO10990.1 DUF2975 domain-containing protein [Flavobacterium profundi]